MEKRDKMNFWFKIRSLFIVIFFVLFIGVLLIDKFETPVSDIIGIVICLIAILSFLTYVLLKKENRHKILKLWNGWILLKKILFCIIVCIDFYLLGVVIFKYALLLYGVNVILWFLIFKPKRLKRES